MKQKIIKLILIITSCLCLTSCKTNKLVTDGEEFLDIYYEYYAGYESDFIGIDLRDFDTCYVEGHFKGFDSFDYFPGQITGNLNNNDYQKRFTDWIKSYYNKKTTIFLIDDSDGIVELLMPVLKDLGYVKVYGYLKGFNSLKELNNGLIDINTGGNGCDC